MDKYKTLIDQLVKYGGEVAKDMGKDERVALSEGAIERGNGPEKLEAITGFIQMVMDVEARYSSVSALNLACEVAPEDMAVDAEKDPLEEIEALAKKISDLLFKKNDHFVTVTIDEDTINISELVTGIPMNRHCDQCF